MKKCPYCFTEMDDRASVCPSCRKEIGPSNRKGIAKKKKGCGTLIAVIVLLFVLIITFAGIINFNNTLSENKKLKVKVEKVKVENEIQLSNKGKIVKQKHPLWGNEICNTIAEGKVSIGMTSAQVIASWGKPEKNNRTVGTWEPMNNGFMEILISILNMVS